MSDPSTTLPLPARAKPLPATPTHPEGNWVVLRDLESLSGKDVKKIIGAVKVGSSGGEALIQQREAAMELLIENWSLDLPIPATPAVTDRLPGAVLPALMQLVEPARLMAVGVGIAPVLTKATYEDQASPTTPSSE